MTGRTFTIIALLTLTHLAFVSGISFFKAFQSASSDKALKKKSLIAAVSSHPFAEAGFELSESGPAGIALAARQELFDYSIGVAFMFLSQQVQGQNVPDVSKRFSIPIVGSFDLQLTNIVVTDFACSASSADLTILGDGFFHLLASDMAANLTFQWHWTKAGLSGRGEGELILSGGTIDWVFDMHKDEQLQKPQLQVITANSNFDTVDLKIRAYSADWLYQAVLSLFNEAVKRQVQRSVASALDHDVPDRINAVLGSLPTRLDVRGLPFSASFEYSIYTAAFVLVKGFGEVEVPESPEVLYSSLEATAHVRDFAATGMSASASASATTIEILPSHRHRHRHRRHLQQWHQNRHHRSLAAAAAEAASTRVDAASNAAVATLSQQQPQQYLRGIAALGGGVGTSDNQMTTCPFETSQLPLNGDMIAADHHMVSIYIHEATANCLLWGLFRSGKLSVSLHDGTIPGLTITTDILALLVPELPTKYPHMHMTISVEALDAPSVSFGDSDAGATLSAYYRLSLIVANESLGSPEVVRLSANLTINGLFDWDTTTIGEVMVHHVVEASELSVPAEQWDNTVTWLLESYGPLVSMRQVVEMVVRTPITSLVSLTQTQAATWERWYALSADVELRLPPPPVS